jgi:TPP-dependent pyruvate/acetoin dehydrogenase alpha subunit
MNKKDLIDFEKKVQKAYEAGEIKAPVHLSGNNEDQLIEIFKKIDKDDWIFSTWRNHYHALLHGLDPVKLFNLIVEGRSMGIISLKDKFYSSSIVGGSLPIALGVAQSIKLKKQTSKVWCFVGDMTFETGTFHECYKYSRNFDLPIEFVVEDNNMSTNSPTDLTWNKKSKIPHDVHYYQYERNFPHHGTGTWVLF